MTLASEERTARRRALSREVCGRIFALMRTNGLTRRELAKIAGVTPSAITGWQQDAIPRSESMLRIAHHFGTTVHWMMNGREFQACQGCERMREALRVAEARIGGMLNQAMEMVGAELKKARLA